MKKSIVILFLFYSIQVYPSITVSYYYQNTTYKMETLADMEIKLDIPYSGLRDMNSAQYHRIIFTSNEKSRLKNLSYAGNKSSFNNVEIGMIDNDSYYIKDITNDIKITVGIGELDSIVIYSCLDFGKKGLDIHDRIATVILVKNLIRQYNGNPEKGFSVPNAFEKFKFENDVIKRLKRADDMLLLSKLYRYDEKSGQYRLTEPGNTPEMKEEIAAILFETGFNEDEPANSFNKTAEYLNFIDDMRKIDVKERFDYLKKYIELNFQIAFDKELLSPEELYLARSGNHKTISFFYYDVLKELGFTVNSYLVTDLKKRNPEDIVEIKRFNSSEKEDLLLSYMNVKPSYNLNTLIDYNPPRFESAVYIVTLKTGKKWIYTTGERWIDAGIYVPERCCSDYTKKGCYYSFIINDDIYNHPLRSDDIKWDVFFDAK